MTNNLDFTALTPTTAELPAVTRTRKSKYNDNHPVVLWLAKSFAEGECLAVTVPEDGVKSLTATLRGAAKYAGVSVKVHASEPVKGKVTVTFQAVEKREYKKRETA